jgi:hypothetical protein
LATERKSGANRKLPWFTVYVTTILTLHVFSELLLADCRGDKIISKTLIFITHVTLKKMKRHLLCIHKQTRIETKSFFITNSREIELDEPHIGKKRIILCLYILLSISSITFTIRLFLFFPWEGPYALICRLPEGQKPQHFHGILFHTGLVVLEPGSL